MNRKLAILLSVCLGVVCAFVYTVGKRSAAAAEDQVFDPTVISCKELLEAWPKDNYHLVLTDYQRGKRYASYDYDQDGNWDLVYVPLFPADLRELGNNFRSVIVYFDDVHNEQELTERLATGQIDTQLWYTQQKLRSDIHSDLAHQYRLMNFSKCVVLQGGFRPASPMIGKSALLVSTILPKSQDRNFMDDEDDAPITNRAGLPDF